MAYRVYLVDDDRFLLDLYAVKFKNAGHEVSAFSGGEDLLVALRKDGAIPPDVILLDLIMPGMGGFEALETIRKEHGDCVFLKWTADGDRDANNQAPEEV